MEKNYDIKIQLPKQIVSRFATYGEMADKIIAEYNKHSNELSYITCDSNLMVKMCFCTSLVMEPHDKINGSYKVGELGETNGIPLICDFMLDKGEFCFCNGDGYKHLGSENIEQVQSELEKDIVLRGIVE